MPDLGPEQIRNDLTQHLGADGVRWDEETLREHSHDWWMIAQLRLLRGTLTARPACVVSPADTAQVAQVLAYANERRIAVVPFGAGSGVCGGVLPSDGQIVVDLRRMNRILDLNETALTVRVQPGMMGPAFEAALQARGYSMRHFPQSIDLSTVGGWVATRAAGQFSTRYGSIEDLLLALEVVLPDGRVVRTRVGPRSAAGPDLRQLFLGSEGTLGIFTELTLRIVPLPESQVLQSFSFATFDAGLDAIRDLVRVGWRPPVLRLYDGVESARHFADAATGSNCLLLVISEGPAALTSVEMDACRTACAKHGGTAAGDAPVAHWLEQRNQVPGFEPFLKKGFVLDTIEVATTWDRIHDLYREVIAAIQTVPSVVLASGHSSHSYAQGTNIYFTFAARPEDPAQAEPTYFACWEKTMEATLRVGGTIAHHHGIGRLRRRWMADEVGATGVALLRALKHAIDPHDIMNPGALLPE
ncbi:MAG TPA: FAD-binding oxidoreductase [Candidatus Kryptonia bacterium]|nr:FAD-binding oxidoreductase [Candidatus Kryptonia bacterium]